jgi:hypothetical protein
MAVSAPEFKTNIHFNHSSIRLENVAIQKKPQLLWGKKQ